MEPRPTAAAGSGQAAPPTLQLLRPPALLLPATRMLLHTGWGMVWIRLWGRAHAPSLHPSGPGRSEMEVASLPQPSVYSNGVKGAPLHCLCDNNLGRKRGFECWEK